MTPERRTAVNRRLTEFEGYGDILDDARLLAFYEANDYCADLNALARLEMKLPPHNWASRAHTYGAQAGLQLWEMWDEEDDGFMAGGTEPTEAEARAEAICQWLESRESQGHKD